MSDILLEQRLWIACAIAREAGSLQKRRFLDREAMIFKFKIRLPQKRTLEYPPHLLTEAH